MGSIKVSKTRDSEQEKQKLIHSVFIYPLQPRVALDIETSYLNCSANQIIGFYIECNTVSKWGI